jgi:hypothetical protein
LSARLINSAVLKRVTIPSLVHGLTNVMTVIENIAPSTNPVKSAITSPKVIFVLEYPKKDFDTLDKLRAFHP